MVDLIRAEYINKISNFQMENDSGCYAMATHSRRMNILLERLSVLVIDSPEKFKEFFDLWEELGEVISLIGEDMKANAIYNIKLTNLFLEVLCEEVECESVEE